MPQSVGFYQSVTVERFGVETPRPLTSVTWWLVCWMSWYRWGKQLPAIQKNKIERLTSRRHVPCLQEYLQQKMPYPLVLQSLSQRKLTCPMPHISITFHYQNISKHPNLASKASSSSSLSPSWRILSTATWNPIPYESWFWECFLLAKQKLLRFGDYTPKTHHLTWPGDWIRRLQSPQQKIPSKAFRIDDDYRPWKSAMKGDKKTEAVYPWIHLFWLYFCCQVFQATSPDSFWTFTRLSSAGSAYFPSV